MQIPFFFESYNAGLESILERHNISSIDKLKELINENRGHFDNKTIKSLDSLFQEFIFFEEYDKDFLSQLSARARNVCVSYKIRSHGELINFHQEHSLTDLRNCGPGTYEELMLVISNNEQEQTEISSDEKELIQIPVFFESNGLELQLIIKKHRIESISKLIELINQNPSPFVEKTKKQLITLNDEFAFYKGFDLNFLKELSTRARNVCSANDIKSLKELIEFDLKNDMKSLRNCGAGTLKELSQLISDQFNNSPIPKDEEKDIWFWIEDEVELNYFIETTKPLFLDLSVRSTNALNRICETESIDPLKFVELFILDWIDFNQVEKLGNKSVVELNKLRAVILQKLEFLSQIDTSPEQLVCSKLQSILKIDFEHDSDFNEYLQAKKLSVLSFIGGYVLKSDFFSKIERDLLVFYLNRHKYPLYFSEQFEIIAKKNNLTRERVRQLSLTCKEKFKTFFDEISFLDEYLLESDVLKESQEPYDLDQGLSYESEINSSIQYNTDVFANYLSLRCIGIVLSRSTDLGTLIQPYSQSNFHNYRVLNINYYIPEGLFNEKTFKKELINVYKTICSKNSKEFEFEFSHPENWDRNQKEFFILLNSLNFNLKIENDQLIIPRTTMVRGEEKIASIFDEEQRLLTAEEVRTIYNDKYEGKPKPLASVRSTFTRFPDLFIYFRGGEGRKTRYGLKEWEQIMDIKPGSIKQLCHDYLKEKNCPVHLFELVNYIKKHRKTTRNNISTNLGLDPHGKYEFFPGSFVGLKEIEYDKELISSLQSVSPVYSAKIGEFMRDHLIYPYNAVVERYATETGLLPIQVEDMISGKIENGVFKIKEENLVYNSIDSDNLVNNIFTSPNKELRGFNPYRAILDENKFTVQVEFLTQKEIQPNVEKLTLDSYDKEFSPNRLILFYHHNLKTIKAFLSKGISNKKTLELAKGKIIYLNSKYRKSIIEKDLLEIDFNLSEASIFEMELLNFLRNGTAINNHENSFKIELLDLHGKSKMDAYSLIVNHVSDQFNTEIGLTDAKSLYEKWKLINA